MEPRPSMPWRVLEAPAVDEDDGERGPVPPTATAAVESAPRRPMLPVLAIAGVALACAVGAFLLATSGPGGTVEVDGGSALVGLGSSRPLGSAGGVAGVAGGELVVEIVGAVRQPGVYRLPAGSRVADLVTAAGGYSPRVDTVRSGQELNLAAPLKDGAQVRVPSRDDASTGPGAGSPAGTAAAGGSGGQVDLNHATQAELEALPGVGPATAQKIIAAREEAPFAAVDELRSRGILGEKTFEKLRDLVSVG